MSVQSRETIHRALAGLLVAALLIGVTHPLAAREMICKMDRPVSAPEPGGGACGPTPESGTGLSLKAASCCHFQAPTEAPTLSVLSASAVRALPGLDAQSIALAIASVFPDVAATASSVSPATDAPAPSSSLTRASILRL